MDQKCTVGHSHRAGARPTGPSVTARDGAMASSARRWRRVGGVGGVHRVRRARDARRNDVIHRRGGLARRRAVRHTTTRGDARGDARDDARDADDASRAIGLVGVARETGRGRDDAEERARGRWSIGNDDDDDDDDDEDDARRAREKARGDARQIRRLGPAGRRGRTHA